MTSKTFERLRRQTALREFSVTIVPYCGGVEKVVTVVSYTPDLAMGIAARENPGFIGLRARVKKVL